MTEITEIEGLSLHSHDIGRVPTIGDRPAIDTTGHEMLPSGFKNLSEHSRWESFKDAPPSLSKAFETLSKNFPEHKDVIANVSKGTVQHGIPSMPHHQAQGNVPTIDVPSQGTPSTTTPSGSMPSLDATLERPVLTPPMNANVDKISAPQTSKEPTTALPIDTSKPVDVSKPAVVRPTTDIHKSADTMPVVPSTQDKAPTTAITSFTPKHTTLTPSTSDTVIAQPALGNDHHNPKPEALVSTPVDTPITSKPTTSIESKKPLNETVQTGIIEKSQKPLNETIPTGAVEKPQKPLNEITQTGGLEKPQKPLNETIPTGAVEKPQKPLDEITQTGGLEKPQKPLNKTAQTGAIEKSQKPLNETAQTIKHQAPTISLKTENPHSQRDVAATDEIVTDEVVIETRAPLTQTPVVNVVSPTQTIEVPVTPLVEKTNAPSLHAKMMVEAAEAVTKAISVSSTLATTGEGEIRIQLKQDVLDGSTLRLEVKGQDLKIIITPATRAAEETFVKHQEAFQAHLAERVTTWRINVGVTQWSARSFGNYKSEEDA